MASRSQLLPNGLEWRLVLAGASLFTLGAFARGFFETRRKGQVLPSPRSTLLPTLSTDELSKLPYPPDVLPGARDVDTPYGSIRVYEFGPEDGRKVLLVHGISTPSIALGSVAQHLVDNGCRVLLFDLFGRGYSDTPDDLEHDNRLFTTQILLVLASSPLSWTGANSGKFSLIGYSLGGGIATTFASYFPHLIDTLILFAPAGLLRPEHITPTNRLLYQQGIIPESLIQRIIRNRLRTPLSAPPDPKDTNVDATNAVKAEVNIEHNSQAVLSKKYPNVTVVAAVAYQVDHHPGFVPAFISSIRHGPTRTEHDRWRVVGKQLTEHNRVNQTDKKVLVVLGEHDPIIVKQEIEQDARETLEGNVEFVTFNAGHEVPVTLGEEIVKTIVEFWRRND
ncbi:hypothetical protein PV10_01966 [Exophiala mesophila]|uniref:AB hydrolase-1 domain-containing protein n=1 Tax=Exophiala mesophila TaxID=212818 RepID=A0A0D1ZHT1_EXOME|nr:uncharacterized protein PV10_01966 [Exophiala mesophila]KIV94177.1 hypothetical protein PV10_01966 [Exophiala mesophila]